MTKIDREAGAIGSVVSSISNDDADASFADRLIVWQRSHGRNDLPWQGNTDPYRIWLSEIMLQQTQVSTVIPYYQRFVGRFPAVGDLAAASLDEVLTLWSGLGYYSRARNLHRAAATVVERHGGRFPQAFDEVLALPGIGRSTAAAICAFAFGQRHAILDGNVKRVLARHAGVEGWAGDKAVESVLWQVAESRLPVDDGDAGTGVRIGIYTQAIMDLGAGPCARSRPGCGDCPVRADCVAHRSGRVDSIPAARPKRVMPHRTTRLWLLLDPTGAVLVERRPPSGIWGGLWSLPEALDAPAEAGIRAAAGAIESLAPVEHGFTHFRVTLEPLLVCVDRVDRAGLPSLFAAEDGRRWLPLDQLEAIALPAPVRTLLSAVRDRYRDRHFESSGLQSTERN